MRNIISHFEWISHWWWGLPMSSGDYRPAAKTPEQVSVALSLLFHPGESESSLFQAPALSPFGWWIRTSPRLSIYEGRALKLHAFISCGSSQSNRRYTHYPPSGDSSSSRIKWFGEKCFIYIIFRMLLRVIILKRFFCFDSPRRRRDTKMASCSPRGNCALKLARNSKYVPTCFCTVNDKTIHVQPHGGEGLRIKTSAI